MRTLLLILPLALLACSTAPASTPASPAATPAPSAAPSPTPSPAPSPAPSPTPSETEPPQPGPSHPAGATPALGSHHDEATVDLRGKITMFHRASYGEPPLATIRVEGDGDGARYARAQVRITRDTKVYQTRGGKRIPFSRLRVDDVVEVTFEGPVAESDPVQAVAAEIVLLGSEPVEQ